jgi:hypothetical protein
LSLCVAIKASVLPGFCAFDAGNFWSEAVAIELDSSSERLIGVYRSSQDAAQRNPGTPV